jgi:hypothetical protein
VWSKPVGDGEDKEDKEDKGDKGDKEEFYFQPTTDDHTRRSQRRLRHWFDGGTENF